MDGFDYGDFGDSYYSSYDYSYYSYTDEDKPFDVPVTPIEEEPIIKSQPVGVKTTIVTVPVDKNSHPGQGNRRYRSIDRNLLKKALIDLLKEDTAETDLDTLKNVISLKDPEFMNGYVIMPVSTVTSFRTDSHRIRKNCIFVKNRQILDFGRVPVPSGAYSRY